jgi:hypothetical protein
VVKGKRGEGERVVKGKSDEGERVVKGKCGEGGRVVKSTNSMSSVALMRVTAYNVALSASCSETFLLTGVCSQRTERNVTSVPPADAHGEALLLSGDIRDTSTT